MDGRRALPTPSRIVVIAFFLTTVYFTGFVPPGDSPNELSRIGAVVAVVEHGTFSIDAAIRDLGDHEDKSVFEGRFYSNKAPGLMFAAIPVYRMLRLWLPAPHRGTATIFILMRLMTVTVVCLLALVALARFVAGAPGQDTTAALVVFAVAFGTPFLFYARSLFSHAWTAALLYLAWYALKNGGQREGSSGSVVWLLLSGLLGGWAAISEYTAAPLALLLAARAAAEGRRAFLLFCGSALVPLSLLLWYDAVCFGSPFTLSSAREAFPEYADLARQGFFGLHFPSAREAALVLFHPARGLFLFSPFWIWGLAGLLHWWRSRRSRPDCMFVLGATVVLFLEVISYPRWEGGWSLGVRYLVPICFLTALALPWALRSAWSRGLFVAATAFSAANFFLLTSGYPHTPVEVPWPASNLSWWIIGRGWVAPNLGALAGLAPAVSLLLPLVAETTAFVVALGPLGRTLPHRWIAAAAGVVLIVLTLLYPPAVSATVSSWRERILGALSPSAPKL